MVLWKPDIYVWKNEATSMSFILHKNLFKIDQRLEYKTWKLKLLEGNVDKTLQVQE